MIIDNAAGLQYFLNEDIYLLRQDMNSLDTVFTPPALQTEPPVAVVQQETSTEEPPVTPAAAEAPALYFSYLGSNAKQFLILCSYPGAEHMDEKHLTALTSALQRKELALADVAILNLNKHPCATVAQLQQYFKLTRLLILGSPGLLNGWDKLTLNQLENLGGIKTLYTYSFDEMMGDRDKTKAFWEQMKVL